MDIPENSPLVYVSFSAEINQNTTESLISVLANCSNSKVQQVYLLLSTPGGSVMNGLNLYNVLKGMPFELIIHNVGSVNSIGNTVFLSGEKRYATATATFMFHGVGFNTNQNQRFEEKALREHLARIMGEQKIIGQIIIKHTNLSEKEVAQLFREAQTKDADFAISKGIIHEIKEVNIQPGCPVISLTFKR
ncbi:MAG: ATP-dependent Clp protease proteolytic subunit [Dehalococcoidales bacterium]|nr:ATP-dependent Clp protease proteolytic subunit [Dehalococcoidales bacterium]